MSLRIAFSILVLFVQTINTMSSHDFLEKSPQEIVSNMSLEEKIGQLCIIAAVQDEENNAELMKAQHYKMDQKTVKQWISDYNVGGIIFLGNGTVSQQTSRLQLYQSLSKYPLFVAQDFEWGANMRIPEITRFPMAMTLGALPDEDLDLIEQMGYEVGVQARLLGVHMNLAPVVDINNNPDNPVIYNRSHGDNPIHVSKNATAYMKGMQKLIKTCAKHFPGHGNVGKNGDSHYTLPLLNLSRSQLENVELVPFKNLIAQHVDAVMMAHLEVPALETEPHRPSSLSKTITTQLLQEELGFTGLVITDGLGMQGVLDHFKPGDIEFQALKAGNDILLCPVDIPATVEAITLAVNNNTFSLQELNKRVLKVITVKQNILKKWKDNPLPQDASLNSATALELKKKLYSHAVTVVHDTNNTIPLSVALNDVISLICVGSDGQDMYNSLMQEFPQAIIKQVAFNDFLPNITTLCKNSTLVIVNLVGNARGRVIPELAEKAGTIIEALNAAKLNTLAILSASPYVSQVLKNAHCLIAAYENDPDAQESAIKVVAGTLKPLGHLPVKIPGINA